MWKSQTSFATVGRRCRRFKYLTTNCSRCSQTFESLQAPIRRWRQAGSPAAAAVPLGQAALALLLQANRNGFFYIFDRTNGEPLFHEVIVGKQTWNLGFTKDGRPLIDPGSVSTRDGVAVCPASGGGTNWLAVSCNPITRLFYFRVSDSCGVYTSQHDPLGVSGNRWFGRGTPANPEKAQQALAALQADYPGVRSSAP